MKKGKKVDINYILTDTVVIILMILCTFLIGTFIMDYIGTYKMGLKWLYLSVQVQILKRFLFRYILLEFLFLGALVYSIVMYLTRKGAKVNKKLAKFIRNNNFIIYETINKRKRIKDKADIYYILKDDYLIINILLHGSSFDDKLKDSREKIEDIFATSITAMSVDFGKVSYEIAFNAFYRLEAIQYIPNKILLDKQKVWDYDHNPHGLIAGTTGSGKTYFVNYLICNLIYQGADITFIDPKFADIKAMGEIVNPLKTACEENQIARLVREFSETMVERQKIIADSGKVNATYRDFNMSPQFLIFDELSAFKSTGDKKTITEVEAYLKKIILMGRSVGCFVILIAQQPNATIIETGIRDQLGLKVALGNIKEELRRMMFGTDIKLHTLDYRLKGIGYISLSNGEPYKYYAPNLGAKFDFIDEIKKLSCNWCSWGLLDVYPNIMPGKEKKH